MMAYNYDDQRLAGDPDGSSPACPYAFPFPRSEGLELDPSYARLRAQEGMSRVRMDYGPDGWLVTGHNDVKKVFGDQRFSRAALIGADIPRSVEERVERAEAIFNMDPPEHSRVRRLVSPAFSPRRAEAMRPRVREICTELVEAMLMQGSSADLVEAVSTPLPVTVICELLGAPLEGRAIFRAASDALLGSMEVSTEDRTVAFTNLAGYIGHLVADRRQRPEGPGDDVLGSLVSAHDEHGDRLSMGELVDLGISILAAGHETVLNIAGNMAYTLLDDRSRWQFLLDDPTRVPQAVEEMLRFLPVEAESALPRMAREDIELSCGTVRRGETVYPSSAAANRDPAFVEDPEALRLDRAGSQRGHLTFGFGPHHCLGASLARIELQEFLTCLLSRVPKLELAGEPLWRTTSLVVGPAYLPVSW